jgi:hypothetical protein
MRWRCSCVSASSARRAASAARVVGGDVLFDAFDEIAQGLGLHCELIAGGALRLGCPERRWPRGLAWPRSARPGAGVSLASPSISPAIALRSSAMRSRRRTSSARSVPRIVISWRRSGTTAPSSIEARTASRISSGRTSTAGGGRRPMRWRAASTSPISPRRLSSERRIAVSLVCNKERRCSIPAMRPSALCVREGGIEQSLVELGAIGANSGDLGFEPGSDVGTAGEPLLDRLEFGFAGALLLALLLGLAGGLLGFGGRSCLGHHRAGCEASAQQRRPRPERM